MNRLQYKIARLILERRLKKNTIGKALKRIMSNNAPSSLNTMTGNTAFVDPTTVISRDSSTA